LSAAVKAQESIAVVAAMTQLTLQSDLGIESVAELQAALQPHLEDDAPLSLAGEHVQRVHAAGLQLLHAFVRDRTARGHHTTIVLPSPTLAAAARQLGLAVSLGVDIHTGEPA
jgi:anti-anti-sigma regulatory factor